MRFHIVVLTLAASALAAPTCPQLTRCNSAGGTYKELTRNSSAACCQACVAEGAAKCAGWIYQATRPDTNCHLKSDARSINPCAGSSCGNACGALPPPPTPAPAPAPAGAKNVLFIVSDDMRPSLGAYGLPQAVTPNLDALASDGVLFTRAHVQFAYCAPSRNSFMSGRRPDATKCYNFLNHFRDNAPGQTWSSLPEHFKRNGSSTREAWGRVRICARRAVRAGLGANHHKRLRR